MRLPSAKYPHLLIILLLIRRCGYLCLRHNLSGMGVFSECKFCTVNSPNFALINNTNFAPMNVTYSNFVLISLSFWKHFFASLIVMKTNFVSMTKIRKIYASKNSTVECNQYKICIVEYSCATSNTWNQICANFWYQA